MKEQFHFKKEMGQNFIFDKALLEQIADASGINREDGVLEIGPGAGTLSCFLAQRARKLLCVELDRTLIDPLRQTLALYPNAEVVQGDILKQDLSLLCSSLGTPCRVVTNLPYNITTPVLERLLREHLPIRSISLMVQKEAGERMMAQPGTEGYGPLSILVSYASACRKMLDVPAECFTPRPHVDSVFLKLDLLEKPAVETNEVNFFKLVHGSFVMRRKTLLNNLVQFSGRSRADIQSLLEQINLTPTVRAEQLTLHQFSKLTELLYP